MELLKRKIDTLKNGRQIQTNKPLVVKSGRQIGKTESIKQFAKTHYENVIEINFVFQKQIKHIFDDGYEVNPIIKNILLLYSSLILPAGKTLFFFDELQDCPDCATSLKAIKKSN